MAARRWSLKLAISAALLIGACGCALAQPFRHPFAVGASEGSIGPVSGFAAWLIEQQSAFYQAMVGALHAIKSHESAGWTLAGVSFAYGVFHAAGPGHGKAVVTSYLVANERALRRGFVISLFAALLQGIVAVALISIAALIFHATAPRMTQAASLLETASYIGIIALGGVLLARKTMAFIAAWQALPRSNIDQIFAASPPMGRSASAFFADAGDENHRHSPQCGHFHGLDATRLDAGFRWREALLTVVTAGARPCSGAILVLVFALAQDMFWVGIGATFAMSLGTALTTGGLAAFAVFAKRSAVKYAGAGSARGVLFARLMEVAAALCILLFGCALLTAQWWGVDFGSLS
jgi:nickel/cobalt exporter